MSHLVMLRANWPAPVFRRSLRDKKGEVTKRLEFTKSDPVEVSAKEFAALKADLGPALVEVKLDGKPRPRPVEWIPPEERESDSVERPNMAEGGDDSATDDADSGEESSNG